MTFLYILAQEVPAPDWAKGPILGFLGGCLSMLVPYIYKLIKDRSEDRRIDQQMTTADTKQLIKDLRLEREEIRVELRTVRKEHEVCLQTAARQEAQIVAMGKEITALEKDVKELADKASLTQRQVTELKETTKHIHP